MLDEKQKLRQIIDVGQEIARVNDLDVLLERVLTVARRFVNADAGSIYIKEENRLKFSYTQNETLQKRLPEGQKLMYSTFSTPINNESISGYVAGTGEMLNVHDVYQLPEQVPYSFNKSYDEISNYHTKSKYRDTSRISIALHDQENIPLQIESQTKENMGSVPIFLCRPARPSESCSPECHIYT